MARNLDLTGSVSKSYNYPEKIGSYSDYYTGTCTRQGYALPKVIGIKALRANVVYKDVLTNEFIENFRKHVERWVTFDHANVARCYGYALDCGPMPAIVMDYYHEGNIMQHIKAKHPSFEEKIKMVRDVAEGLGYLHALKPPVVHGDLRAANIFVTKKGRAVIADYELAYIIPSKDYAGHVFEENTRWLAPELLYEDNSTCTAASDVFAFAMTVIEITTNGIPFASKLDSVVLRLRDGDRRPDLPAEVLGCTWLSKLVQRCWDEEPSARPTASRIVNVFIVRPYSLLTFIGRLTQLCT
ncbi:hypothetical protein APHAL10511_000295 [Amanita phalloides]|nr:hypothetical protein APHAL10511_000295 [Amanita phalloides]